MACFCCFILALVVSTSKALIFDVRTPNQIHPKGIKFYGSWFIGHRMVFTLEINQNFGFFGGDGGIGRTQWWELGLCWQVGLFRVELGSGMLLYEEDD